MNDFVIPKLKNASQARILLFSRFTAIFWGLFAIAFAFASGAISESVIVAINKIGSLFYGSIAASFLAGMLTRRANGFSVRLGIAAGVTGNFMLWRFAPHVSWLWWNLSGCFVTFGIAWIFGQKHDVSPACLFDRKRDWTNAGNFWKRSVVGLAVFGVVIILVTFCINQIL